MHQHCNLQKRDYEENSIYFITVKIFQDFMCFKELAFCELFIKEWKSCKRLKKFKLYEFCVVYDYLNLLIHLSNEFNIPWKYTSLNYRELTNGAEL